MLGLRFRNRRRLRISLANALRLRALPIANKTMRFKIPPTGRRLPCCVGRRFLPGNNLPGSAVRSLTALRGIGNVNEAAQRLDEPYNSPITTTDQIPLMSLASNIAIDSRKNTRRLPKV